jgi:hypothetical protein
VTSASAARILFRAKRHSHLWLQMAPAGTAGRLYFSTPYVALVLGSLVVTRSGKGQAPASADLIYDRAMRP